MRIVIRNEKFLYIKIVPVFSAENRRFFVVMQTEKKPNHISVYQHYVNCCEKLGIPKIKESLDDI